MHRQRIGIIGGGASGMMAAITASEEGADVTILEKNDKIGRKLLATGNGKCNLSNLDFDTAYYNSGNRERAAAVLGRFGVADTMHFFEKLGLLFKNKNGYLYPASEQASSVLDLLRYELQYAGVRVVCDAPVTDITAGKTFHVRCGSDTYEFDRVIIACGSKASPKTGSDGMGYTLAKKLGHTVITPVPALVQLKCKEPFFKSIAGVRCDARLTLLADHRELCVEQGELQLTDYGISGIPVFQLSRFAAYALEAKKAVHVRIDFLPDMDTAELEQRIRARLILQADRTAEEFVTGILNKKLGLLFLKLGGIKANDIVSAVTEQKLLRMFLHMKELTVTVTDTNSFANAQICAGGVSMDEVTDTLESMLVPGLYFSGEVLDVDGRCGGYNLQWAWSSGYVAGYYGTR